MDKLWGDYGPLLSTAHPQFWDRFTDWFEVWLSGMYVVENAAERAVIHSHVRCS